LHFGLPNLIQYKPKCHPLVLRAAFFFPEPFPTLQDGVLALLATASAAFPAALGWWVTPMLGSMNLSRVVNFERTTKSHSATVNVRTNTAHANGADQRNGSVRVPSFRGEGSGFA
jgi:hypothetical protein